MNLSTLRSLHDRHRNRVPVLFFCLGFTFDALILQRIDEPKVLLQQALYLAVCAFLIGVELREAAANGAEVPAPPLMGRLWKYRRGALHFLMGTLLNSYTIFYFKSASAWSSLFFIGLLVGLLLLNEFKKFEKTATQVHVAFLSLSLISYLVCLFPILLGFIGDIPFACATLASVVLCAAFYGSLKKRLPDQPLFLQNQVLRPLAGVQLLFVLLYYAHIIPPVPLSVSFMGIYHDIQKENGEFHLTFTRPFWKFWQHGDQSFWARPGDSIFCFVRVFSPTRFKEELQVRWFFDDPRRGWVPSDAIALPIVGGREEGFRGMTKKSNFQPGDWKVQVETRDGREIGRIRFNVSPAPEDEPLTPKTDIQ